MWPKPGYSISRTVLPAAAKRSARTMLLRGRTVLSAVPVASSIGGSPDVTRLIGCEPGLAGPGPKTSSSVGSCKGRKS